MNTNSLLVIDANKVPLKPCQAVRARILQSKGKANLLRHWGVLILNTTVTSSVPPYLELRVDPGSKKTGFALVDPATNTAVWGMELEHRGAAISQGLLKRAGFRRTRRAQRRYRQARFNRRKPDGWLAPSLKHRVLTTETWIKRICQFAPVASIAIERVKFDLQKLQAPSIQGVEYQQGTLAGYSVREALLEHWGRECVYCGAKNAPLQIEHIVSRSQGGSNRFSNLTLSCEACNQKKGNQHVEAFLSHKPTVLNRIKVHCKASLRDAAAVNTTRTAIVKMAESSGLPVSYGDGASTKMIRTQSGLPKAHWIDAACVATEQLVKLNVIQPLLVTCKGHGTRQARRANASGFPAVEKPKAVYTHIQTGDVVRFRLLKDRKNVQAGTYIARVRTPTGKGFVVMISGFRIEISNMKAVEFVQHSDGYSYEMKLTTNSN